MTRIFETDGNYVPPKPYHLGSSEEDFESNLGDFDLDFHLAFYEKSGWAVFSFVWICSEYNGNLSYGLLPDPNSKLWSDSKQECLDFVAGIASTKLSDQTIRCFVEGKLEQEWTGKK